MSGFSPDGSRLAIMRSGDLLVLEYPSGEAHRFPLAAAMRMSWMPDSRRVVVDGVTAEGASFRSLDTANARRTRIFASPFPAISPAVPPDGKRLLFTGGTYSWDPMEVEIASGRVRPLDVGHKLAMFPAWAPSGTNFSFVTAPPASILDVSAGHERGRFFRTLFRADNARDLTGLLWSPDGSRLLFNLLEPGKTRAMVLNASSGLAVPIDDKAEESSHAVWSPDSRWVVYWRRLGQDRQIVKTQPGSSAGPIVLQSWPPGDSDKARRPPLQRLRDPPRLPAPPLRQGKTSRIARPRARIAHRLAVTHQPHPHRIGSKAGGKVGSRETIAHRLRRANDHDTSSDFPNLPARVSVTLSENQGGLSTHVIRRYRQKLP